MHEDPKQNAMDDDSLHALLAGSRLSGPQRDRILERVLDAHARPRVTRRLWPVALAAALPAAALLVLFLRPSSEQREATPGEWLVAKGETAAPIVAAACPSRPRGECRSGDRLIFEVDGTDDGGHFAAYADCAGRERIWYFPSENGSLPAVPADARHFVVPQAARIGDEHGQGPCTLHLLLLEEPAERANIAAGNVRAITRAESRLTVTP
jgi:hypothetical protein